MCESCNNCSSTGNLKKCSHIKCQKRSFLGYMYATWQTTRKKYTDVTYQKCHWF